MELTIQNLNKITSITNFVVAKIFPLASPITAQAALVSQTGATAVATTNASSQAELFDTGYSIDGSTLALVAKIDGFLLALGTTALYGTGVTLATGTILSAGGLVVSLSVVAGVVAAASNENIRDIMTDPEFVARVLQGDIDGLNSYLNEQAGIDLLDLIEHVTTGILTGEISDFRRPLSTDIATDFSLAKVIAFFRSDPLTLDLDGDGLETTGINTADPILFDHNADGIRTATGWVLADDALLVLDRNGNGVIDNGTELFGDSTPLNFGGNAADGFAALAQEDTNADGKVDNADVNWNNLRLWRDLNQDGISQADELFTPESQNVAALIVAKTENAVVLANGNQIADLGGFLRTDGSGGTLGAAEQLADIDLASNPFYSEFTDHIAITAEAQALPDMSGAGQVRDLREAASLQTPEGAALAILLTAFSLEPTRAGQLAMMDELLDAWSETSEVFSMFNANIATAGIVVNGATPISLSYAQIAAGYGAPNSPVGAGDTLYQQKHLNR